MLKLKNEEYILKEAIENKYMVDALADILYVTYGAGVSFGIDLDKVLDQVHGIKNV